MSTENHAEITVMCNGKHFQITDTGISFSPEMTNDEFIAAGLALTKIERGLMWAIGDWYNNIPWGDKRAACERFGIDYINAKRYAVVSRAYQMLIRDQHLSFKHHDAVYSMSEPQRSKLLRQAVDEGWSVTRLKLARAEAEGKVRVKKEDLKDFPNFDAAIEYVTKRLPAPVAKHVAKEMKAVYEKLHASVVKAIEDEVAKRVDERLQALLKQEQEVREEKQCLEERMKGLTERMTQEEFQMIRSLLHPDKHPGEEVKYNRAFETFNRLAKSINPYGSKKSFAQAGWDKDFIKHTVQ